MSSPVSKYVPPSISESAFNCPHCGVLAKQHWFNLKADAKKKDRLPFRLTQESFNREAIEGIQAPGERESTLDLADRIIAGAPFIERNKQGTYVYWDLYNADLSQCYNCDKVAIWGQSALVHPVQGDACRQALRYHAF